MTFVALRNKYEAWAHAEFGAESVEKLDFNELLFPAFADVERAFADAVAANKIHALDENELQALLYLVARSWDAGRMIAWLSKGPQLSNVANLSGADSLVLAEAALRATGAVYNDARTQLATILPRVSLTDPKVWALLERFFECNDMYTKRIALTSLATLKHPKTREYLHRLWTDGDEWARITCLAVIEEHIEDDGLLDNYLALANVLPGDHLAHNREEVAQRRSLRP